MKMYQLSAFTKGWFVGDFSPSILRTRDVEVAIKRYKRGDTENAHRHKVADELTAVVSGRFRLNGREFSEGDIIWIQKEEVADFLCLEDGYTTVVKIPSVMNDKYFA